MTALDSRHVKSIPDASTNPGTAGGSAQHHHATATHNHSISHTHATANTSNSTGTAQDAASGTPDAQSDAHNHAIGTVAATTGNAGDQTPNTDDKDNDPARWDTIWIESDGTPTTIPNGAITFFNNANLPASWTQPANGKDKFLRGAAAAGNGGGTGGGASHTHAGGGHVHSSAHVHPSGTTGNGANLSNSNTAGSLVAADTHAHAYDVASGNFGDSDSANLTTTGSATPEPPWIKLAVIQSPGAALTEGLICAWLQTLASIPTDWVLCDGTKGTPNLCQGKYIKGCNLLSELLNTGGTTTHAHTAGGTHTHTWTSSAHTHSVTVNATASLTGTTGSAQTWASAAHAHSGSTSGAANALTVGTANPSITDGGHDPAYVETAFIMYHPAKVSVQTALSSAFSIAGQGEFRSIMKPVTAAFSITNLIQGAVTRVMTALEAVFSLPSATRVMAPLAKVMTALEAAFSLPSPTAIVGGILRSVTALEAAFSLPNVARIMGALVKIQTPITAAFHLDTAGGIAFIPQPLSAAFSIRSVIQGAIIRAVTALSAAFSLPTVTRTMGALTKVQTALLAAFWLRAPTQKFLLTRILTTLSAAFSLPSASRVMGALHKIMTALSAAFSLRTPGAVSVLVGFVGNVSILDKGPNGIPADRLAYDLTAAETPIGNVAILADRVITDCVLLADRAVGDVSFSFKPLVNG